jgi:16S rRNA (uracil1498-N3)-methyltransferase
MHRFFVPPDTLTGPPPVVLPAALAHQIARVLRLAPGDQIVLLDGGGDEWLVRLTAVAPARVEGVVERRQPGAGEPRLRLTLYQALLKGDHLDYVLQKGTEVGLAAIVPVLTERTIARTSDERKLTRWRRIVQEAAEQAGRAVRLSVCPALSWAAACQELRGHPALVLWEGEREVGLGAALAGLPNPLTALALLVGPEGGLSESEVALARAAGLVAVTLGPRVLRAETAGLVAASALLYASGDLGGPPA